MLDMVRGVLLGAALLAATPAFAQFGGRCTRDDMKKVADGYLAAVAEGNAIKIPMGNWMRYSENGDDSVSINSGVFEKAKKIDYHHEFYDAQTCQIYVEFASTDPAHPYVAGTRISAGGGTTSEMEAVVTDAGDWLFDAAGTAKYANAEKWDKLGQPADRAAIKAAADAYLDYFKNKGTTVPWGTPCARLEGGLYTGKGQPTDSCNVGVPANIDIVNRRYIIDEDQGAVAVFNAFGPSKRPDIHTFRVENGKIRYVHTLTVCDKPNCGLPMPGQQAAATPKS